MKEVKDAKGVNMHEIYMPKMGGTSTDAFTNPTAGNGLLK